MTVTLKQSNPYYGDPKNVWRFVPNKVSKQQPEPEFHIVATPYKSALCGGTPGGEAVDAVEDDTKVCWKCVCAYRRSSVGTHTGLGLMVGYVRRCLECKEPLSEELPYNMRRCIDCQRAKDNSPVVRPLGPTAYGARVRLEKMYGGYDG